MIRAGEFSRLFIEVRGALPSAACGSASSERLEHWELRSEIDKQPRNLLLTLLWGEGIRGELPTQHHLPRRRIHENIHWTHFDDRATPLD